MADKAAAGGGRSAQDDSVAGQQRFRDSVKKEVRYMQMYEARNGGPREFALNPKTLAPVEPKVGYVSARKVSPEETAAFARDVEDLKSTLAKSARMPQEKTEDGIPETESQEVGFFHSAYYKQIAKPYRVATHKTSEEVVFAKVYATTMKAGPYGKTQPVAR